MTEPRRRMGGYRPRSGERKVTEPEKEYHWEPDHASWKRRSPKKRYKMKEGFERAVSRLRKIMERPEAVASIYDLFAISKGKEYPIWVKVSKHGFDFAFDKVFEFAMDCWVRGLTLSRWQKLLLENHFSLLEKRCPDLFGKSDLTEAFKNSKTDLVVRKRFAEKIKTRIMTDHALFSLGRAKQAKKFFFQGKVGKEDFFALLHIHPTIQAISGGGSQGDLEESKKYGALLSIVVDRTKDRMGVWCQMHGKQRLVGSYDLRGLINKMWQ